MKVKNTNNSYGVVARLDIVKSNAVLGYLFFREIPGLNTIIGATIITGSSIFMFRYELRHRKRG